MKLHAQNYVDHIRLYSQHDWKTWSHGINLKGCLYFIEKGNFKFFPFKMKGYLKNCPSCMY